MKKLISALLIGATALSAFAAGEDVVREHRSIWMSSMLASTWPGAAITESNTASTKRSLDNRMAKLASQGINTVYYHVRAHCDATYNSSYEPYSSAVAGTRGGTPAYDPFGCLVESAHKHGIEVYAWVNPYRYSQGGTYSDSHPGNYGLTHPEWLLSSSEQAILNPALPEVRQRIVDICTEIATNYDIDGMIFDDYFYHSSIGLDADADLYNAYAASVSEDGRMTQAAWRRENVNMMVRDVSAAVKQARPYAVFAIGPAGRISPDDIADYGLTPGPYGDMNYTGLYADPIRWLSEGLLDFLSPQVYWISYFDRLTEWYSVAVPHFGRHLYESVDCSRLSSGKSTEYLRQIDFMRSHVRPNESGVVFFDLGAYLNYGERIDNNFTTWGDILHLKTFPYTALAPLHSWRGTRTEPTVGAISRDGDRLQWTAPEGNVNGRFAVYGLPEGVAKTDFAFQPEYLEGVVYEPAFDVSADPAMTYGVAVYDRYGRLHAIRFEDCAEMAAGVAPTELAPAAGAGQPLCDLTWKHEGAARYLVEISESEDFASLAGCAETMTDGISSANVADLRNGKTYWWRVVAYAADHTAAVSAPASFVASALAFTSPAANAADVSFNPSFTWTAAPEGTGYKLEISTTEDFANVKYTVETAETEATVPARTLVSGKKYFARLTATRGNTTATAAILPFATADRTDYAAPALANPASDGLTLHADECIAVEPWEGMTNAYVEIAASESFPVRSRFSATLADFETQTKLLGDVRIASKALVAGQTYYVRTRGSYSLQGSTGLKYTGYGPVRSFVYSDESGVFAPETAADAYVDAACTLHMPTACRAEVFDLAGRRVLATPVCTEASLETLPAGCYIIRFSGLNQPSLKWVR